LLCNRMQQLQRLKVGWHTRILGFRSLAKLDKLEELSLRSIAEEAREEINYLQYQLYQMMPKLRIFCTSGLKNHHEPFPTVDCEKINSPCALEECFINLQNEHDLYVFFYLILVAILGANLIGLFELPTKPCK